MNFAVLRLTDERKDVVRAVQTPKAESSVPFLTAPVSDEVMTPQRLTWKAMAKDALVIVTFCSSVALGCHLLRMLHPQHDRIPNVDWRFYVSLVPIVMIQITKFVGRYTNFFAHPLFGKVRRPL